MAQMPDQNQQEDGQNDNRWQTIKRLWFWGWFFVITPVAVGVAWTVWRLVKVKEFADSCYGADKNAKVQYAVQHAMSSARIGVVTSVIGWVILVVWLVKRWRYWQAEKEERRRYAEKRDSKLNDMLKRVHEKKNKTSQ